MATATTADNSDAVAAATSSDPRSPAVLVLRKVLRDRLEPELLLLLGRLLLVAHVLEDVVEGAAEGVVVAIASAATNRLAGRRLGAHVVHRPGVADSAR